MLGFVFGLGFGFRFGLRVGFLRHLEARNGLVDENTGLGVDEGNLGRQDYPLGREERLELRRVHLE